MFYQIKLFSFFLVDAFIAMGGGKNKEKNNINSI